MDRRSFLSMLAKVAAVAAVAPAALKELTTTRPYWIGYDPGFEDPLTMMYVSNSQGNAYRVLGYDHERVDMINMETWGKIPWTKTTFFDQEGDSTFPQHFPVARHHK